MARRKVYKDELCASCKYRDEEVEECRKENEELQQKYLNSQWKIGVMERKINAKDAVIARLKRENFDLNGCLLAEQELAEKRNAIIKELADDLSGYICDSECNGVCASFGNCCSKTSRQIIAKAREVVE